MRSNKVCIVGTATSWRNTPFDSDCEIWGLNHKYNQLPRFNRWFDCHIPHKNYYKRFPEYCKWLKDNQNKLYIMDKSEEFPEANIINWKYLINVYGRYFTSSIAWMLAVAIEEKFTEIALYGVELNLKKEYEQQRACVEYFIGIAKGKGINIYIDPASILLKAQALYGF